MNLWTLDGVKSWAAAAVGVTMLAVATPTLAESGARADYCAAGSQLLLREMVLRNCPITPTKNAGQPHRIGVSGSGLPSRSIRSNSHASRPGVRQYFEKLDVCICLCLLSSNDKRPDDPHCRSTNRKRSCSTPSAGP